MQYRHMQDLIESARTAGSEDTEWVNEQLGAAFDTWLDSQHLEDITEEEEDRLRIAFEEGYGICMH